MANSLPYLASPGTIEKALEKIKSVPTPAKVTQDFVKAKLLIKGGAGNAIAAYLKKIGLVNADGTPSNLYIKFRNPASCSAAAAEAFRIGYAALYEHNEYAHDLPENDIKGLIIQITGCAEDARTIAFILSCIKHLKKFANFDAILDAGSVQQEEEQEPKQLPALAPARPHQESQPQTPPIQSRKLGMNLSYTINLNLPPSTDIAVFNAIFKSLKENLLRDIDEHSS